MLVWSDLAPEDRLAVNTSLPSELWSHSAISLVPKQMTIPLFRSLVIFSIMMSFGEVGMVICWIALRTLPLIAISLRKVIWLSMNSMRICLNLLSALLPRAGSISTCLSLTWFDWVETLNSISLYKFTVDSSWDIVLITDANLAHSSAMAVSSCYTILPRCFTDLDSLFSVSAILSLARCPFASFSAAFLA